MRLPAGLVAGFRAAEIGAHTDAVSRPLLEDAPVREERRGALTEAIVEPAGFDDREHAGRQLAEALAAEPLEGAVVVGLARGGVVVAAEVARALGFPLDALAVRKVGHPLQPEYGIGAVTPDGGLYLRGEEGLTEEEVGRAVASARTAAEILDQRLHARYPALDLVGKTCLLVDDGLATGATMTAAVRWAKTKGARRVIVAVPVGAAETVAALRAEADAVVCLAAPVWFGAVGLWYGEFGQVSDEEVVSLLKASNRRQLVRRETFVPIGVATLPADVTVPTEPIGWVVFAHGSGSSRRSPRNIEVARALNEAGLAAVLFDLLTPAEELDRANVFDIELLAERLVAATRWLADQPENGMLPVGYFGASTGAAAALWAAAELGTKVAAVVSRGGRPDLAAPRLELVTAPTLLIVGGRDELVLDLNREAAAQLRCEHDLAVVPGSTHLFEEPGALDVVARLAKDWFVRHLAGSEER